MQKLSVVNGFCFEDERDGRTAEKEAEAIRYIKARTNLKSPEAVWNVYTKLVDNQVFETPVGLSFLHELYDILLAFDKVTENSIPKINVKRNTGSSNERRTDEQQVLASASLPAGTEENKIKEEVEKAMEPKVPDETLRDDAELQEKRMVWAHDAEFERQKRKLEVNKNQIRNLKIVIFMLAAGFIALLLVVYFSDDSKFVNVETKVINQYSEWEQNLKDKEAELNERERIILEMEQNSE